MENSAMTWRKSSYSLNGGECVETATDSGTVMIRDTTNRDGCTLSVSADVWSRFIATL